MKIELLQSPLDKGESWEAKSKREIDITRSSDNRGCKPNVYLSICAPKVTVRRVKGKVKRKIGPMEIESDLFIPTELAIQIGKQLIKEAKAIDKERQEELAKKYSEKRAKTRSGKVFTKKRFTKAKTKFPKPTEVIDKW